MQTDCQRRFLENVQTCLFHQACSDATWWDFCKCSTPYRKFQNQFSQAGRAMTPAEINSVMLQEKRIAYHWHNCHQCCKGVKKTACDLQIEHVSIQDFKCFQAERRKMAQVCHFTVYLEQTVEKLFSHLKVKARTRIEQGQN